MGKQNKSSSAPSKAGNAPGIDLSDPLPAKKPAKGPRNLKSVKSGNAGNSSTGVPLNSTAARDQRAIEEGRAPPLFPVGERSCLV